MISSPCSFASFLARSTPLPPALGVNGGGVDARCGTVDPLPGGSDEPGAPTTALSGSGRVPGDGAAVSTCGAAATMGLIAGPPDTVVNFTPGGTTAGTAPATLMVAASFS